MAKVAYSRAAREMMAAIDDRWISEHGFNDNPLWEKLDAAIATLGRLPEQR